MARNNTGGVFEHTKSHKNETVEHFFTKIMIMKILSEQNHDARIEYTLATGNVDCYDLTTSTAYEVEPRIDTKKLADKLERYTKGGAKEVIMIPYKKIWQSLQIAPENLRKWKKEIDQYLHY